MPIRAVRPPAASCSRTASTTESTSIGRVVSTLSTGVSASGSAPATHSSQFSASWRASSCSADRIRVAYRPRATSGGTSHQTSTARVAPPPEARLRRTADLVAGTTRTPRPRRPGVARPDSTPPRWQPLPVPGRPPSSAARSLAPPSPRPSTAAQRPTPGRAPWRASLSRQQEAHSPGPASSPYAESDPQRGRRRTCHARPGSAGNLVT